MEARFEAAQPALLGALLDLFVKVLAALPSVAIAPEHRPRMADFAALGEAVFRVHGKPAGAFLARYNDMRKGWRATQSSIRHLSARRWYTWKDVASG